MTTAFYANTNPAHEVSAAATGLRREEYLFWRSLQPEEDADIEHRRGHFVWAYRSK